MKDLNRKKTEPQEATAQAVAELMNQEPEGKEPKTELKTQRVTFVLRPSTWESFKDLCEIKDIKPTVVIGQWIEQQVAENESAIQNWQKVKKQVRG